MCANKLIGVPTPTNVANLLQQATTEQAASKERVANSHPNHDAHLCTGVNTLEGLVGKSVPETDGLIRGATP
jgi:hypothetical protein